jgi:protein TonB
MKKIILIAFIILICNFLIAKSNYPVILLTSLNNYYQIVTPPEYPGGEKAFHKYLNSNLKWPDATADAQGIVLISFFVEKSGYLSGFKIEKSLGKEFDAEALRVLMKSPRWIPAMKNERPIKSKYSVPIKFFLKSQ